MDELDPHTDETRRATETPQPSTTSSPSAYEDDYVSLLLRDGLDLPIPELQVFVTLPSGEICSATTTVQGAVTVPLTRAREGQISVAVQDVHGAKQSICTIDAKQCKEVVIIRSPKVATKMRSRPHQRPVAETGPAHRRAPVKVGHDTAHALPTAPAAAANAPASGAAPGHTNAAPNTSDAAAPVHWWSANGAVAKAWERLTRSGHAEPGALSVPPGFVAQLRNAAGQPMAMMVGPECPNKDNLRLGRNNIYREAIMLAAKRLGLIPQAICALIDCEAGKMSTRIPLTDSQGLPLKDKKGNPRVTVVREVWNAQSGNAQSGAAGLTQFLASTWLDHVRRPGFYIHEQSVQHGWLKLETTKLGSQWAFVLSNGDTTTAPSSHRNDANIKQCLAMRLDPTWSILAAADYGNANLKLLKSDGFKIDNLSDMDKAKLMYLMHHEGESAGPAFINNTLGQLKGGTAGLRKKFEAQLGANGVALADKAIKAADDDVEIAYRAWLRKYIDDKFQDQAARFFCSTPASSKSLSDLFVAIGGEQIRAVN